MNPKRLTRLLSAARSLSGLPARSNESGKPSSTKSEKWLRPKDARNAALIHIGHEAAVLGKIQRQNAIVENQVKSQLAEAGMQEMPNDEDDTGVNVGNEYHYAAPQPSPLSAIFPLATVGLLALIAWKMLDNQKQEVPKGKDTLTDIRPGFGEVIKRPTSE